MKKEQLIKMIREAISKVLNENAPAPSKPAEKPRPTTIPGKPRPTTKPTITPRPNVRPAPKNRVNENEQEILNKIVQRYKKLKGK